MASERWVLRCLLFALPLIWCAVGCSNEERRSLAATSKPVAPARHVSLSAEEQEIVSPKEQDPVVTELTPNVRRQEDAIASSAKAALKPLLSALFTYHRQHGRYPVALDDIVRDSLLPKLPAR